MQPKKGLGKTGALGITGIKKALIRKSEKSFEFYKIDLIFP
jgi:hypothetical protein